MNGVVNDAGYAPSEGSSTSESAKVIVLNGASCAGKTTTALALLGILDQTSISLSIDDLNVKLRESLRLRGESESPQMRRRLVLGYHRMAMGFVSAGNSVVMDHVLGEDWRLQDLLSVLRPVPALLVGVHCPLDELLRRTASRNPRRAELITRQYQLVHKHGLYDLQVDTSKLTPAQCAEAIQNRARSAPTAFDRLRAAR